MVIINSKIYYDVRYIFYSQFYDKYSIVLILILEIAVIFENWQLRLFFSSKMAAPTKFAVLVSFYFLFNQLELQLFW